MHVYFLSRIRTLLPLAKENKSMVNASSQLNKRTNHPLSFNKSSTIEKTYTQEHLSNAFPKALATFHLSNHGWAFMLNNHQQSCPRIIEPKYHLTTLDHDLDNCMQKN